MIKAIAFDLDDTLISKRQYDHACLRSVAAHLAERFSINFEEVSVDLWKEYDELNRSHTIDAVLEKRGLFSKELLKELVEVYRKTPAGDCVYPDTVNSLEKARSMGLAIFLVTDGKIEAQSEKIKNTGIEPYFTRIIFTYAFGEGRKKPDKTAFEQILGETGINANEMIYVGDNPYRDFLETKRLGIHTIRIKREDGQFRFTELPQNYEADQEICELDGVFEEINRINGLSKARGRREA